MQLIFNQVGQAIKARLPVVGIVAFSLCSVESLHNMLTDAASDPGDVLYFAAIMVELTTAWLVHQLVETGRKLTKSNISKQDKKFYGSLFVVFSALALPSLGLSVAANTIEFCTPWLGWVFPTMSVGCAVGSALPGVSAKYEQGKVKTQQAASKRKAGRVKEKAKAVKVKADLVQAESSKRKNKADLAQTLADLAPMARRILDELTQNPRRSQADLARELGVKRQVVGYHTTKMADLGLIGRNGGRGFNVLVDLEIASWPQK